MHASRNSRINSFLQEKNNHAHCRCHCLTPPPPWSPLVVAQVPLQVRVEDLLVAPADVSRDAPVDAVHDLMRCPVALDSIAQLDEFLEELESVWPETTMNIDNNRKELRVLCFCQCVIDVVLFSLRRPNGPWGYESEHVLARGTIVDRE